MDASKAFGIAMDSQLFWGIVTLVLAAVAFNPKVSMNASNLLLALAWFAGCFGIYRSGVVLNWYQVVAIWFVFGSALAMLASWLQPPLLVDLAKPNGQSEEEILKKEKVVRSPKLEIAIYPSSVPPELSPYRPPLKLYNLMVQNTNAESASVSNLRIEFHFRNIVAEIKPHVLQDNGGLTVGRVSQYGQRPDGSVDVYEEIPIPGDSDETYSFDIQQATLNNQVTNLNFAYLRVGKMIRGAGYIADIVVDTSRVPSMEKKPDEANSYNGKYVYEINGKQFTEYVRGSIPN